MSKIDSDSTNVSKQKQQKNFNFEIDISQKNIFVVERKLSGSKIRNKVTNKHDWSHKLNDEIWNVFRKDCSWSFKHADAYASGDVSVKGCCSFKDCTATIEAHAINNKTLRVKVNNYDKNIIHVDNKRRITGTAKEKMEKIPNLFYSPELEEIFIYILCRIPLWSNLMMTAFHSTNYSASSGGSESSFKGFKHDYGINANKNSIQFKTYL